jgi:LmbE family N-acetylglucosaminyl deacetylase
VEGTGHVIESLGETDEARSVSADAPIVGAHRVVAVSPHIDDAILSAGGLLARAGRTGASVDVVTAFAGVPGAGELSPVAKEIHGLCGLPADASAVTRRLHENINAVAELGASSRSADFLDSIYRLRADGSWLCGSGQDMFALDLSPEPALRSDLIEFVDRTCELLDPDVLLTCAAVGGHVDHRHTRTAVQAVARRRHVKTFLWEDLPYAIGVPRCEPGTGLRRVECPVGRDDWSAKVKGVSAYASQLRMLWPDSDWRADLERHAISGIQPVEVLWEVLA